MAAASARTPPSAPAQQQQQQQEQQQQPEQRWRATAAAAAALRSPPPLLKLAGLQLALLLLLAMAQQQQPAAAATYGAWHECSAQAVYGGMYGAELLANLSSFRSGLLSHVWRSFDPSVPWPEGFKRFDPVRPFIRCPPHQPLIRYGNEADGGKLLCDVSALPQPCLIYSLGSNGDYSFERDMLKNTACEIHTFDCTYNGVSQDRKRHTYHKLCVGSNPADPSFRTWDQITRELGHQHRSLDVFKIDIEGHEPSVLAELRHNTPLPRQVVIELHMRPSNGTAIAAPAPRTPAQLALLVLHMAGLGYGIVGQEDNIWGEPGCCAEWTFLHVERPWVGPGVRLASWRLAKARGEAGDAEELPGSASADGLAQRHRRRQQFGGRLGASVTGAANAVGLRLP